MPSNPTRWILWDAYVNEERGPLDLDGVRAYLVGLDADEGDTLTPEIAEGRDLAIAALDAGELGRLVELAAGLDIELEEYVEPEPETVHMCGVVEVRRAACGDLAEVVTIRVVPEIDAILAEDGDDR